MLVHHRVDTVRLSQFEEDREANLSTGERRLISGRGIGSGPGFERAAGIALEAASTRALVVDDGYVIGMGVLFTVDLATGERTLLSGPTRGSGPTLSWPSAVVLDSRADVTIPSALIAAQGGIVAVDLTTGDCTVVTSTGGDEHPACSGAKRSLTLCPRSARHAEFKECAYSSRAARGGRYADGRFRRHSRKCEARAYDFP